MAKRGRPKNQTVDSEYVEPAAKKTKTRAPRVEWTAKDEAALKFGLKVHGASYSAIQKEYFPALKPKDIQNKVRNNEELRAVVCNSSPDIEAEMQVQI